MNDEPFAMPDRVAIDAKGYGWRVWDDQEEWSMVPTNPDNSPIPQPVTWFTRDVRTTELFKAALALHDATWNPPDHPVAAADTMEEWHRLARALAAIIGVNTRSPAVTVDGEG